MRIAVITTSYPESEDDPSGHFVRAEVRELERAGNSVRVVAPRAGGAFGWPGVAARVRERPHRALEAARWIASAGAELRATGDFDRIVAHWSVPCAFPIVTHSGGDDAPLEIVSHGGDVRALVRIVKPLRAILVRKLARRAEVWRFVSESLRDDLLRALAGTERAMVLQIATVRASPIEVDCAAREAGRAKREELRAPFVAVAVARLVASKRIDAVIEHVARSERRELLVIVGDGPERARLEALAKARGVDARFTGKLGRRDALAWIAAADVVLHASREEGLSTVVREASALGVAVKTV